jgi:hypothetical protein
MTEATKAKLIKLHQEGFLDNFFDDVIDQINKNADDNMTAIGKSADDRFAARRAALIKKHMKSIKQNPKSFKQKVLSVLGLSK